MEEIFDISCLDTSLEILKLDNTHIDNEYEIYEKKKKRKEKIVPPFEMSDFVRYKDEEYFVLSYYIVTEYFEIINHLTVEILENSKKGKIYYTLGHSIDGHIVDEIESSELSKIE